MLQADQAKWHENRLLDSVTWKSWSQQEMLWCRGEEESLSGVDSRENGKTEWEITGKGNSWEEFC